MCGIAGFFSREIGGRREKMDRMLDVIIYRGPDEAGVFHDGDFSMGMRRLSIIDLDTGKQPIFNENGNLAIVFNGEIYNFKDLYADLSVKGHGFYTKTDTEVVIHLYEEYGADCVQKLNGMFAFCIYDKKKKKIFLACDRAGKKPLHYFCDGRSFVFASEIKSILALDFIERKIDRESLKKYLLYGYVPTPNSMLSGIRKLPAGHYMEFSFEGKDLSLKKYWDFDFSRKTDASEKELAEEIDRKLSSAVERRLVADVPLGVFLSGGVDSSLVVALMSKFLEPRDIKTFSIGFKEKKFDESPYAKRVADMYRTDHHIKIFSMEEARGILTEIVKKMDEPFSDPSILPTYLLSKYTKEHVTVALGGDGGDEMFGGYPKYYIHRYARHYDRLPNFMKKQLVDRVIRKLPLKPENRILNYKVKKFLDSVGYKPEYRNQFWTGPFSISEIRKLMPERGGGGDEVFFEDVDRTLSAYKGRDVIDKMMYLDAKLTLKDMYLVKVDRMSMLASLEVRSPFLDTEIMDLVGTIKSRFKVKGRETKYILKKTAEKYLPKDIVYRHKKGFGLPLAKWMRESMLEEVKGLVGRYLDEGIFDKKYVDELIFKHGSGRADNSTKIWNIYVFLNWYKNNICKN